jgi:hypothetical protein
MITLIIYRNNLAQVLVNNKNVTLPNFNTLIQTQNREENRKNRHENNFVICDS